MASTLQYPGINLPLRHMEQDEDGIAGVDFYRCGSVPGAFGSLSERSLSELVQVREVAMLLLMDRLTDKLGWNKRVFEDNIVTEWRHEALAQDETSLYEELVTDHKVIPMPKRTRLINEAAFDYVSKHYVHLPGLWPISVLTVILLL